MRNRLRSLAVFAATLLPLATGCAGNEVSSTTDDLRDSWAKPTEHGTLVFNVESSAEFGDATRFHAWTFELSGKANVAIETDFAERNLDTVMYLYRRKPGASAWGAHVKKNDDAAGRLSSRIAGELAEGEYRLIVRAAKEAMRGEFTVLGTCSGEGCPTSGETCAPAADLPQETDYSQECAGAMVAIVDSAVKATRSTTLPYRNAGAPDAETAERCALGALERAAVDHYYAYWSELTGWADIWYDTESDLEFEVDTTELDAGTIVGVRLIGSDEMQVNFVFDGGGRLVARHHDEQSPTVGWFCGKGEEGDTPDEFCVGDAIYRLPHPEGGGRSVAGETLVAGDKLDGIVLAAVDAYARRENVAETATVTYEGSLWEDDSAGRITVKASGVASVTYHLFDGGNGPYFIFEKREETVFLCERMEDL